MIEYASRLIEKILEYSRIFYTMHPSVNQTTDRGRKKEKANIYEFFYS